MYFKIPLKKHHVLLEVLEMSMQWSEAQTPDIHPQNVIQGINPQVGHG